MPFALRYSRPGRSSSGMASRGQTACVVSIRPPFGVGLWLHRKDRLSTRLGMPAGFELGDPEPGAKFDFHARDVRAARALLHAARIERELAWAHGAGLMIAARDEAVTLYHRARDPVAPEVAEGMLRAGSSMARTLGSAGTVARTGRGSSRRGPGRASSRQ